MDVAFAAERIVAEVSALLEVGDFEGAEELLWGAVDAPSPSLKAFAHLQFARVYRAWNKLSSAVDHLNRAAEIPDVDPFLKLQISSELGATREARAHQRP